MRWRRRIRDSKLPERKLLADFDFKFLTGIDKSQIMELATLGFVERKQWLILAGMPSVPSDGKTESQPAETIPQRISHLEQNVRRLYLLIDELRSSIDQK